VQEIARKFLRPKIVMFPSNWENTYHCIMERSFVLAKDECFADAQLATLI
jgi:hypothetical protein